MTQPHALSSTSQTLTQSPNLKLLPMSLRLVIRPAQEADAAAIWALVKQFQTLFLDDYQSVNPVNILERLDAGELVVVESGADILAVMAFWGIKDNLYGNVSFLVSPTNWRLLARKRIPERLIQYIFDNWDVMKIKARPQERQKSAINLLNRLKFKHTGVSRNETKVNGEPHDVINFELHRPFWKRYLKREGITL